MQLLSEYRSPPFLPFWHKLDFRSYQALSYNHAFKEAVRRDPFNFMNDLKKLSYRSWDAINGRFK